MFTSKKARFYFPALVFTLLLLASLACGSTAAPAATDTPTGPQTNGECSWRFAEGAVPPEIGEPAQQLFGATGVDGTLVIKAVGENNSCDRSFHLMGVDFVFTLRVSDLRDYNSMAVIVAKVDPIPEQVMQASGKLGNVSIRFETEDASCFWQTTTQQCD